MVYRGRRGVIVAGVGSIGRPYVTNTEVRGGGDSANTALEKSCALELPQLFLKLLVCMYSTKGKVLLSLECTYKT